MKFIVPNYSCLQNPWLGGYRPQIPVLSVLCPSVRNWIFWTPPEKYSWVRHCLSSCLLCHIPWNRYSSQSEASRLLVSRVRIAPGAWMFVCCVCCVLFTQRSLWQIDDALSLKELSRFPRKIRFAMPYVFIIPSSAQFLNTLEHIKLFKILLHVPTILSSSGSNLLPR